MNTQIKLANKSTNASVEIPTNLALEVKALDFSKLQWKLTQSAEATWNEAEFKQALVEYCKYLSLKKWHPDIDLVPSKLVDKVWHEHILDTHAYQQDCQNVFGYFLHHYPYFGIYDEVDQQNLQVAFEYTNKLYQQHFGGIDSAITNANEALLAARCEGHACHAPSTCACRTPGSCK